MEVDLAGAVDAPFGHGHFSPLLTLLGGGAQYYVLIASPEIAIMTRREVTPEEFEMALRIELKRRGRELKEDLVGVTVHGDVPTPAILVLAEDLDAVVEAANFVRTQIATKPEMLIGSWRE